MEKLCLPRSTPVVAAEKTDASAWVLGDARLNSRWSSEHKVVYLNLLGVALSWEINERYDTKGPFFHSKKTIHDHKPYRLQLGRSRYLLLKRLVNTVRQERGEGDETRRSLEEEESTRERRG